MNPITTMLAIALALSGLALVQQGESAATNY
jgi:hypothetical protein